MVDEDYRVTTYVLRNGELVEKDNLPYEPQEKSFFVMPDISPFVTQEGVAIGGRRALREYERANGVKQVGSDFDRIIKRDNS